MNKELLKEKVDQIIADDDYESAHGDEDDLHLEVIREFCPEWVKEEIDRLSKADFPRHCA